MVPPGLHSDTEGVKAGNRVGVLLIVTGDIVVSGKGGSSRLQCILHLLLDR